jgi:hypothetical protein
MGRVVARGAHVVWAIGVLAMLVGCGGSTSGTTGTAGTAGSPTVSGTPAGNQGGAIGSAHITQPFDRTVAGAECFAGTGADKGKAAFGFPNRDVPTAALAFSLGPLTDGSSPGQENNKPYTGAGTYDNIGMVVRPESGAPLIGFGSVTVNGDLRTGAFQMTNPSASGTWDCGMAVNP